MPRKNPLPETEVDIAERLVRLRQECELSREELAEISTLGFSVITRVELHLLPLRYSDARKWLDALGNVRSGGIAGLFPINPLWVAEELEPITLTWGLRLPAWQNLGVDVNERFSFVIKAHRAALLALTKAPPDPVLPESWIHDNLLHLATVRDRLAKHQASLDVLDEVVSRSLSQLAESSSAARSMLEMQRLNFTGTHPLLTKLPNSDNSAFVHHDLDLDYLLRRARQLTRQRGCQTALAAFVRVPQSRVSEWLAGKCEPDGRNTLRLLQWVEQQERKQTKSPASGDTPAGRKNPTRNRT